MKILFDTSRAPVRSEEYVVQRVVEFLRDAKYRVVCEVPSMGQSIDIVATKGRWLTCIEVKLSDWKRGLMQCRAHRVVADYVVLVVASARAPTLPLVEEATARRLGIIHFNRSTDSCDWTLKPKRIKELWLPQRRVLSSMVRELGHDG